MNLAVLIWLSSLVFAAERPRNDLSVFKGSWDFLDEMHSPTNQFSAFSDEIEMTIENPETAFPSDSDLSVETPMIPELSMLEAIEQNDWPAFVFACNRELHDASFSVKYMCLAEVIDRKMSTFLRSMLGFREFRLVLGTDLLDMAAKDPNVLYVVANVEFEKCEASFLKDEVRVLKVIKDNLMRMPAETRKLILNKFGYSPKFGANKVQIIDTSKAGDIYERLIGDLASLHFSSPKVDKDEIIQTCDGLITALREKDIEALKLFITSDQIPRRSDIIQMILSFSLLTKEFYLLEILAELKPKFETLSSSKVLFILKNAIRTGVYPQVMEILENRAVALVNGFNPGPNYGPDLKQVPHRKILDDYIQCGFLEELVSCGDLFSLACYPYLSEGATRSAIIPIRLARAAYEGNVGFVVLFMEMNPNKIILIDAAWPIVFHPRTEALFNLIIQSL